MTTLLLIIMAALQSRDAACLGMRFRDLTVEERIGPFGFKPKESRAALEKLLE